MDNKIKRYLDRVVMELVKDTILDYDREEIHLPFFPFTPTIEWYHNLTSSSSPLPPSILFYEYGKKTFGLTKEESEYVWKIYEDIVKDKIKTGRSLPS